MEIKSYREIYDEVESQYKDFHFGVNGYECAEKAAKIYAEQFIDLASEEASKVVWQVLRFDTEQSILKLKEQLI